MLVDGIDDCVRGSVASIASLEATVPSSELGGASVSGGIESMVCNVVAGLSDAPSGPAKRTAFFGSVDGSKVVFRGSFTSAVDPSAPFRVSPPASGCTGTPGVATVLHRLLLSTESVLASVPPRALLGKTDGPAGADAMISG